MEIGFTSPVLLWLLLALVPLTLFYVVRTVRSSRRVPSISIWKQSRTLPAASFVGTRFHRVLEWFCAALFLFTAILVAAGIHDASTSKKRHFVLLVDNSSSMLRTSPSSDASTLLQETVDRVNRLLTNVGPQDSWTVVRLAPAPSRLRSGTGPIDDGEPLSVPRAAPIRVEPDRLEAYVSSLSFPSSTGHRQRNRIYLLTDRQVSNLRRILGSNGTVRVIPVGGAGPNVAITEGDLVTDWKRQPERLRLRIQNFSSDRQTFPLRLYSLDRKAKQVTMDAGAKRTVRVPVRNQTVKDRRIGVFMDTGDDFPLDNGGYFLRMPYEAISVRVHVERTSEPFLAAVVRSMGPPFVPSLTSDGEETIDGPRRGTATIHVTQDRVAAVRGPVLGIVRFSSPDQLQEQKKTVKQPEGISSPSSVSMAGGLDFGELRMDRATLLEPGSEETGVLSCDRGWIGVRGTTEEGIPYLKFGFALSESNFPVLPEFPLLLQRAFSSFLAEDRSKQSGRNELRDLFSREGDRTNVKRSWLQPDGALEDEPHRRKNPSFFGPKPGWYRFDGEGSEPVMRSVNFFHPSESRMNRREVVPPTRTSKMSAALSTVSPPYPLRNLFLFLSVISLGGFWSLVLSS